MSVLVPRRGWGRVVHIHPVQCMLCLCLRHCVGGALGLALFRLLYECSSVGHFDVWVSCDRPKTPVPPQATLPCSEDCVTEVCLSRIFCLSVLTFKLFLLERFIQPPLFECVQSC